MDHNRDRQATFRESRARTHVLSKEVRHLREEKSKQVRVVLPPTAELCPSPSLAHFPLSGPGPSKQLTPGPRASFLGQPPSGGVRGLPLWAAPQRACPLLPARQEGAGFGP